MSFLTKKPKATAAEVTPVAPTEGAVPPTTQRAKRLQSGGVQSTFLGSLGQAALPAPASSLTGSVGG